MKEDMEKRRKLMEEEKRKLAEAVRANDKLLAVRARAETRVTPRPEAAALTRARAGNRTRSGRPPKPRGVRRRR